MDAYHAYLRGLEAAARPGWRKQNLQLAIDMFERALELDPRFALAWAELAQMHVALDRSGHDRTQANRDAAREEALRALEIEPDLGQAHLALGSYYASIRDWERAYGSLETAAAKLPGDSEVLTALGLAEQHRGRLDDAMGHLERASSLDPHSSDLLFQLGWTAYNQRRYEMADSFYERAAAVAPDNPVAVGIRRLNTFFWKGWQALEAIGPPDPQTGFPFWEFHVDLMQGRYAEAEAKVDLLPPEGVVNVNIYWPKELFLGWIHSGRGEDEPAREAFDAARRELEAVLAAQPDDDRVYGSLGLAYAWLGRKEEAIRAGRKSRDLLPPSKDAMEGPVRLMELAQINAKVGEADAAFDVLRELFSLPVAGVSVHWLEVAPSLVPLRDHPRYRRFVEEFQ